MTEPRQQCDEIWQFRLEHGGALPRQRSEDLEEKSLGQKLNRLQMRERGGIGRKKYPCEKQLSSADKEYLRNTLVEPMPTATTAGVAGAGAHAAPGASTARKIGEKVLE